MRGLAVLVLCGIVTWWLAVQALLALVDYARPRRPWSRPTIPEPLLRVQGAHPEREVGRPAAPGSATPGRPRISYTGTGRAWITPPPD